MAWLVRISKFPLKETRRIIHIAVKNNNQLTTTETHDDDDLPILMSENPFKKDKKVCILCKYNVEPNYKNTRLLSQFQSSYTGRIYGRHITGLCKDKQERVEREILKAQNCGLMAIYNKNPKWMHDPKLFDPDHPFRHHKY